MDSKEEKTTVKTRESNIELLRIFAMILITFHHFSLNYQINDLFNTLTFSFGKLGVNIFVLISGYFLINSKFKVRRLIKLWLEVEFYSIITLIIGKTFGFEKINLEETFKLLLPISYCKYWFIGTYLYLMILMPFINMFVKHLNKKQYKFLLILLTIMFSGIYSVLYKSNGFKTDIGLFETLVWFIYIYLLAGYIRLYGIHIFKDKKATVLINLTTLFTFVTIYIIRFYFFALDKKITPFFNYYSRMNSIFILLMSLSLFYIFLNMKVKYSKTINYLGHVSFAVYLIQESFPIRRKFWVTMYSIMNNYHIQMIIVMIYAVIILFITATIAETIRIQLLEKNIFKLKTINKYCDKIDNYVNNLI